MLPPRQPALIPAGSFYDLVLGGTSSCRHLDRTCAELPPKPLSWRILAWALDATLRPVAAVRPAASDDAGERLELR